MLIHIREATPQDVDVLLTIYERAYHGGYSACFDRYGPIGPEDFWWVQTEKAVSVVEIDRHTAGLVIVGQDRGRMLVEELLLTESPNPTVLAQRVYAHLDALFKKARQDAIMLRAAETNTFALLTAQQGRFLFTDALVVAEGAGRQAAAVPHGYTIRRAAAEHARQVAKLMDELAGSPAGPRPIRGRKREGEARVWIAERERYAAGFAEVRIRDGVGWWTAAVRETHRGKGLGTALAGAALEFCRTKHLKPVTTYWALDFGAARLAQRVAATTERTYLYLQKKI